MSEAQTAEQAKNFHGDKLYQERARAALPLLIRQAKAQKTIFYADLAEELEMPNPRNLNFVLGSVGKTLIELGSKWGADIPPLQCLVINQADELPGDGVDFFIEKEVVQAMTKPQRRAVIGRLLQNIFTYERWNAVLAAFDMKPATTDFSKVVRLAALGGFGGGESEHHQQLKSYVAAHPEVLGLSDRIAHGVEEYALPSGDRLDVLFRERDEWIAVEVKSHISDDSDLVRGYFQCIKYQAVIEAFLLATNRAPNVRTALVTTRTLTVELLRLKNLLGIEVILIDVSPMDNLQQNPIP